MRTTIAIAASLLAATAAGAAPAAASDIIAADTSPATATVTATVPTAVANRPQSITVSNHGGGSVVLFAKGERIRRVLAPGSRPAVFTGLTPGRVYTVAVSGQPIGAVRALQRPLAATHLVVRTTDRSDTVALNWQHRPSVATGGSTVSYEVVAQSPASRIATTVVGARSAVLTGLDPSQRYSFSVTPRNSAGSGRASTARMDRSLAELGAPTPGGAAGATGTVAAAPSPGPTASAAPAGPAASPTRTVYVCPDGFTETAGLCQTVLAYTFHKETRTSPYTYHQEQVVDTKIVSATFNGTAWTWSCPAGYDAGGGQWGVGVCKGTVTASVKDYPPAGWYDNGSAYAQDYDVKDALPTGYLDDGTQWVKTAAKIAMVVPA